MVRGSAAGYGVKSKRANGMEPAMEETEMMEEYSMMDATAVGDVVGYATANAPSSDSIN